MADSLLAAQGVDAADQLRRFREWQQSGRQTSTGQAVGISSAMAGVLAGAAPSLAGTAEPLARAGAAVLFGAATPQAVFPAVEACIGVTHRSPMVLSAGRLYASLLLARMSWSRRSGDWPMRPAIPRHRPPPAAPEWHPVPVPHPLVRCFCCKPCFGRWPPRRVSGRDYCGW